MSHDYSNIAPNKLCGKFGGAVASPLRVPKLDHDILTFRIAEGAQTAPESISERMRRRS
jgi:hypothetical protein